MAISWDLLILSAALLAVGLLTVIYFRRRWSGNQRIFKIYADTEEIDFLIGNLPQKMPPFILEATVPHLGKKIEFFVSAGKNEKEVIATIKKHLPAAKIEETEDFSIFYHGGETIVSLVEAGRHFKFSRLNFSKINEVGESCLLQMLRGFGKNNRIEIRLLVSAPSQFQAKEIFRSIIPNPEDGKIIKVKNSAALIGKINSREP